MDTTMSATVDFVAPEMPEPLGNQELGKWGEELAARYLQAYGYVVLVRNWRRRAGELDLVTACPQRKAVVAVEVKTRNAEVSVGSIEAITQAKLARLRKLTGMWLQETGTRCERVCLDLVAITVENNGSWLIRHLRDIS